MVEGTGALMPTRPLRECAAGNCHVRVVSGRCPAHRPKEADRRNTAIRRLYRSAPWLALREQLWRTDPLCAECAKAGRIEPWTDLDHIVPHRGDLRLFWDVRNLQGLCASHHAAKTATGK